MEEKHIRELNLDEMEKVSGGVSRPEIPISFTIPGPASDNNRDPYEPWPERRRYD